MADSLKCLNCGAALTFDPATQKLTCDYCGGTFTPEEVEAAYKQVVESESPEEGHKLNEIVCNSCGAKVVSDEATGSSFCTFCGSPAISSSAFEGEFRPERVIPFKISREQAIESFTKWCKGGRFTPLGFLSEKNLEKLKGVYVPFWLFDIEGTLDVEGKATTVDVVTTGNTTKTTTSYYDVFRKGKIDWTGIPFDGVTKIDDNLMEALEPFNLMESQEFRYSYLPGFFADIYDLDSEALKPRAEKRANEYLAEELKKSLGKFKGSATFSKNEQGVETKHTSLCLFPVWFFHYKYLGKSYHFVMNGESGEIAGTPPTSLVKGIFVAALSLGIWAVIVRIIIGLILGGFVG